MQWVEVVHAVTMARFGPFAPTSIDSSPAVMLMMLPGMKKGEMRRGPFAFSSSCIDSISGRPPMPEPKLTPTRSAFCGVTSSAASRQACSPAAMPYWMKMSMRRASFGAMYGATSKPFTSPAIWLASREGSKRVIRVMPGVPARARSQASETVLPSGLMIPSPVTTTLRRVTEDFALCLRVRFDVVHGLLDGRDLLGFLVGDLGLELLLERHHELHGVERVGAQVVDERGFVLDFGLVHAELLRDDFLDALFDVFHPLLLPQEGAYFTTYTCRRLRAG